MCCVRADQNEALHVKINSFFTIWPGCNLHYNG